MAILKRLLCSPSRQGNDDKAEKLTVPVTSTGSSFPESNETTSVLVEILTEEGLYPTRIGVELFGEDRLASAL